ncbi:unnamed protein product [Chilo suppressalis]|uniref:Zinc finger PHD-type domain-containing protein n=1 Tax=Chilo suppressalis TaxID=168631 RepID=A0ABN8BCT5_CHISP|nr:unnamed protein product [Chilo suppressalis]
MKCAVCDASFNDGVQCGACKKYLDFNCANITETGYRKLGPERRLAWKCPQCKLSRSSSPSPGGDSVLETILSEIRDMKHQLSSLPTLVEDVKCIKRELEDLKSSCDFNSAKLDEQELRISDLENRVSGIVIVQSSFNSAANEITALKKELALKEQWARLNNVEIKGVPMKSGENLFELAESLTVAVGYSFPKNQINYIARVPVYNSKEKSIIINFNNRYVKEECNLIEPWNGLGAQLCNGASVRAPTAACAARLRGLLAGPVGEHLGLAPCAPPARPAHCPPPPPTAPTPLEPSKDACYSSRLFINAQKQRTVAHIYLFVILAQTNLGSVRMPRQAFVALLADIVEFLEAKCPGHQASDDRSSGANGGKRTLPFSLVNILRDYSADAAITRINSAEFV